MFSFVDVALAIFEATLAIVGAVTAFDFFANLLDLELDRTAWQVVFLALRQTRMGLELGGTVIMGAVLYCFDVQSFDRYRAGKLQGKHPMGGLFRIRSSTDCLVLAVVGAATERIAGKPHG